MEARLATMLMAVAAAVVGEALADTVMVGSSVHTQTVAPPGDLRAAATGDHSADKGYRHTHQTNGGDGYKHFDSFHKKDGDSFGYEKHSTFGKGDQGGDGGEYHESSSYNSDDDGSGHSDSQHKPKVISYHFESQSGTPRDYSNYDPETYEGDYTALAPQAIRPGHRRAQPDPEVEVTGPLQGEEYQSLYDISGETPAKRKVKRQRGQGKEPQTAGTEEDAEYDYYDGEEEGDGDAGYEAEYYTEGGDYEGNEGEGDGGADYYY